MLLPVSLLADVDPGAAAAALAKYDDTPERGRLRDTRIPLIDAGWTDVVFLSPVHPHAIWRAWWEITGRERAPQQFWSIPADAAAGAVVLDRFRSLPGDPIDADEVTRFDPDTFATSMDTTPANRTWLEDLASRGLSGAWFNAIPHVLVPHPVPLDDATVIDWSATP